MFKRLKELFSTPEPKEPLEVSAQDLASWARERLTEHIAAFEEETREHMERLREAILSCRKALEALNHAELRNPKIEMRAKQIMEGNRKGYVNTINAFLDRISPKGIKGKDRVLAFVKDYDYHVNVMSKSSARSYFVLQEFLAHESKDVSESIKQIDKVVKAIKEAAQRFRILQADTLADRIDDLEALRRERKQQNKRLSDQKRLIASLEKELKQLEKQVKEAQSGPEMKRHNQLLHDIELAEGARKATEQRLFTLFAPIERPLRKFARTSMKEKLVNSYLEDFTRALLDDQDMEIAEELQRLGTTLHKISLKDRQKDKAEAAVAGLTSKTLEGIRDKLIAQRSEADELRKQMSSLQAEEKLTALKEKRNLLADRIENERGRLATRDLDDTGITEEIKSLVRIVLKEDITVGTSSQGQ